MDHEEVDEFWWYQTDNAFAMLEELFRFHPRPVKSLKLRLHAYYLACCRAIWPLLPHEDSRMGVELGEKYLAGEISDEELSHWNWDVEGAAFHLDYNNSSDIERWIADTNRIPAEVFDRLLHPYWQLWNVKTRELLRRAAYFADFAMVYSKLEGGGHLPASQYAPFLSADLLRQHIGNPFRGECCGRH